MRYNGNTSSATCCVAFRLSLCGSLAVNVLLALLAVVRPSPLSGVLWLLLFLLGCHRLPPCPEPCRSRRKDYCFRRGWACCWVMSCICRSTLFFLLAMPSRCIAVFCFCCFACCAACPRPAGLHGRSLTVQGAGGFMTSAWRFLTCNQAQRPTHGEQGACSTWLSLSMLLPVSASLHGAEAALSRSVPEGVRLSCSDMPHALPSNQQCGASTVPSASSR